MDLLIGPRARDTLRRARAGSRLAPALVYAALACGAPSCDTLVDAHYRGDPLFSFTGQLVAYDDVGAQGYEFRTTLLWLTDPSGDPDTQAPHLESAVEQASASVELSFPSEFRVDLFAPPDARMLVPGTGIGVALIAVYEDRDRNGRLTVDARPSELVGGARYEAIVFAKDDAAARAAPFEVPIAAGFQLVRIPLFCGAASFTTCPTPLGAPCADSGACGEGGTCVRELDGVTWPGGSCLISEDVTTCSPPEDDSVGLFVDLDGRIWFAASCFEPGACRAGYRCDEVGFACVPEDAPPFELPFAPSLPKGGAKATCDVPLGAPCVGDRDCGIGQCLVRDNGALFPGGYCALTVAAAAGCEPAGGVEVPWDFAVDGDASHWFARCASDRDCRAGEGYTCDTFLEACLPESPVALELEAEWTPNAACYGTFGGSR